MFLVIGAILASGLFVGLLLYQLVEVFEKGSRDLLQNMERDRLKHGDAGFSLYDWINLCTMDTICGRNSKGSYFTGKQ